MANNFDIPIINFTKLNLNIREEDICQKDVEDLADQVYSALSTVGFLYLENHGLQESKVGILIIENLWHF